MGEHITKRILKSLIPHTIATRKLLEERREKLLIKDSALRAKKQYRRSARVLDKVEIISGVIVGREERAALRERRKSQKGRN